MKKFNVVHCLFEQSGRFRDYIGFENDEAWYQVATDRLDGITAKEREAGIIQQTLFDYKEI